MNHLFDLINQLHAKPQPAVLATVIAVKGSAYRQPGARMLILADGTAVGMVSGGCLEKHLIQRAFWLTEQGACVKTYYTADDSMSEDEEQYGFGLGCQGTIKVLFERIEVDDNHALLSALNALITDRQPQPLATVIYSNTAQLPIGTHWHQQHPDLAKQGWQCVAVQNASRKSGFTLNTYQKDTAEITVFQETLLPPLHLLICGAGQDAIPLIDIAHILGWQITVIDSRLDYIQRHRHDPKANFHHLDLTQSFDKFVHTHQHTALAIMTHSLTQDRHWLKQALHGQNVFFYIGQLGPRSRTQQLLAEINADTNGLDNKKLHYPIGLPLGGDTPEAVALSIVSQIQQQYHAIYQS